MGFLTDMKELVGELTGTIRSLRSAPDKLEKSYDKLKGPDDYFQRPIDSVAKKAKSSVLFFPVVGSESLSPEVSATIARAIQVRATEYVQLWVTNLDPQAGDDSKAAIIGSLRGSSLKDAIFDEQAGEIGTYVEKNLPHLIESGMQSSLDLREPLEKHLLSEAILTKNKNQVAKSLQDLQDLRDAYGSSLNAPKVRIEAPPQSGEAAPASQQGQSAEPPKFDRSGEADDELTAIKKTAENKRAFAANSVRANERIDQIERELVAAMHRIEAAIRGNDTSEATRLLAQLMQRNDSKEVLNQLKKHDERIANLIESLKKLPSDALEEYSLSTKVSEWKAVDFDKVNRFPPVLLDLTVQYKSGERVNASKLKLGVKSVVHVIPSVDLVTGLGTALQRDSFFLQFLRLTSGETSFVKDFVLNLGAAKARASSKTSSGTKMLETLRRQSEWNERRRTWLVAAISKRGFVPPTTTVLVTADEVDKIRSLYGVDFSKPSVARDFLKSHNLMGFAIVDEGVGLVRFFEDGDDDFDRIPMSEVKERGNQTSVKDMMTILARN